MSIPATLLRQPKWLVLAEALILTCLIGWIDHATGWEWSFFIFYALPIVLVVVRTDWRHGTSFALLCTVIWSAANVGANPYHTNLGFALAVATRLFYFTIVVIAASALKEQRELDRAKIEMLERTRELEKEILRATEREQRRIGQDLHDSLGPQLAAIGYAATFLADEARTRGEAETQASALKIREMSSEAIALTRALARGIFPVQMDESGLSMALEDLARTTSRVAGMEVTFFEHGSVEIESPERAMHLYRITQEALNNAARHGGAQRATIVLSTSGTSLSLVIADDGKGMPPVLTTTQGMGLHSMKYRARLLEGTIEIRSNLGDGTVVACEIPIHRSSGLTSPS